MPLTMALFYQHVLRQGQKNADNRPKLGLIVGPSEAVSIGRMARSIYAPMW